MSEVYVVSQGYGHEGAGVYAVYGSQEAAIEMAERLREKLFSDMDIVTVDRFIVDSFQTDRIYYRCGNPRPENEGWVEGTEP